MENKATTGLVGIFDSGVGGLSVVKALRKVLAQTSFVYFGDTARFPYGGKSPATICRYAVENTQFLISKGAEVIVVGCNTATSVALPTLQKSFSLPIFGVIEPAAKKASTLTKTGRIGVIGTARTIKSKSYTKAIHSLLPEAEVFSHPCPLLVSIIEEGSPSKEIERLVVREYLRPLKQRNIDTLLLGCTHYALLTPLIQEELGADVAIIDPAETVAEAVSRALSLVSQKNPSCRFFASDDPSRFKRIGEVFLGMKMGSVSRYTS